MSQDRKISGMVDPSCSRSEDSPTSWPAPPFGARSGQAGDPAEELASLLAEGMADAWGRGERPSVEDILTRHPYLAANRMAMVRLIYEEICLRDGASEEVVGRFPQWRSELAILRDCHDLVSPSARLPIPGETLAGYRLRSILGRGLRGCVFLASQPDLADRPVVLKVTPRAGDEHLSLARLQHTHIVPLYAMHEVPDRALRVLCMPYLGGATLAKIASSLAGLPPGRRSGSDLLAVLDEARSRAGGPLPGWQPTRRPLAASSYSQAICWIGACLADALHHAHQRGLLHLDVKPSNVLIADDGQPMLLDFHLARGSIRPGDPMPRDLGGTPGFMAPEQAAMMAAIREGGPATGAVDERADIYALGATLSRALAGEAAGDDGSSAVRLTKANPRVSAGLADILGRCLARDPADRYQDAAALAADLRRHLADLPLEGVANRSPLERYRKWRRRHPGVVALGLLLAVSWSAPRGHRQHAEDLASSRVAFPGPPYPREIHANRDELDVGGGLMIAPLFDPIPRARRVDRETVPAPRPEVPPAGPTAWTRFPTDQEVVELRLRGAVESCRRRLGEAHPELALAMTRLALAISARGDLDGAEPLLNNALAIRRESLGPNHTDVAASLNNLALLRKRRGDPEAAEALLRECLAIAREAPGESDTFHATALNNLALVRVSRGDPVGAEPLLNRALAIRRKVLGPDHPEVATSLASLAHIYLRCGDPSWARLHYQEALAIRRKALGPSHPETTLALTGLAQVHWEQGDWARVESAMLEALEAQRERLGPGHPACASSLAILAGARRKLGDLAGADDLLRRVLAIRRAALGERHPHFANALGSLALIVARRGDPIAGQSLLRRALAIRVAALGEAHPVTRRTREQLDSLVLNSKEFDVPEFLSEWGQVGLSPPPASASDRPDHRSPPIPPPRIVIPEPMCPSTIAANAPRNRPMEQDSQGLHQSLAKLEDLLSDLAERMLHAARKLQSPGLIPDDDLPSALAYVRAEFASARDELGHRAAELGLNGPAAEDLVGLEDLVALLGAIVGAEAEQERLATTRRRAIEILEQIAQLTYAGQEEHSPLASPQSEAESLRARIVEAQGADLPPEALALAGDDHPLAHLLILIHSGERLDDESWARHHESVLSAFGKGLAAAAARGRIRLATGETPSEGRPSPVLQAH